MNDLTVGDIFLFLMFLIHVGNVLFYYLERGYIFWPSKKQKEEAEKPNAILPKSDDWWYLYTVTSVLTPLIFGFFKLLSFLIETWNTPLSQLGC